TAHPGTGPAGMAPAGTAPLGLGRPGTAPAGMERPGTGPLGLGRPGPARPGPARPGPAPPGPDPLVRLPLGAGCVITADVLGVPATLAAGAISLVHRPHVSGEEALELAVLSALVIASWIWPLVMYRGTESEAHHLDEGFFVIMALILPAGGVI